MQMAEGFMADPPARVMLISQGRNFLVFVVETVIIYCWLPQIKRSPWPKHKTTGEQDDARIPVQ
jgi:hypothetical protein